MTQGSSDANRVKDNQCRYSYGFGFCRECYEKIGQQHTVNCPFGIFHRWDEKPRGPVGMPDGYEARKAIPLVTGCLDYFPDALLAVAELSRVANKQHNPGKPLHWAREKSTDEVNTLGRHLLQRGTRDTDGIRHSAKVAWRALAMLQKEIEAEHTAATTSSDPRCQPNARPL